MLITKHFKSLFKTFLWFSWFSFLFARISSVGQTSGVHVLNNRQAALVHKSEAKVSSPGDLLGDGQ